MVRSVLQKNFKVSFFIALVISCGLLYGFKTGMDEPALLAWTNKCLGASYDPSGEQSLKTWQLTLTADGFIRLRKQYQKGKEEYYSFQLHRFNNMNYMGTTVVGTLQLKTVADDIIVQTFNDRKGDVDSMSTQLNIPVKNMEPEQLDTLQMALYYFKNKSL